MPTVTNANARVAATTEIGLSEAIGQAQRLMAGQVRGRLVVRTRD
ncbi:MAG TPA: hypothetical protein VGF26_29460 [Ramlibacter sp.]